MYIDRYVFTVCLLANKVYNNKYYFPGLLEVETPQNSMGFPSVIRYKAPHQLMIDALQILARVPDRRTNIICIINIFL